MHEVVCRPFQQFVLRHAMIFETVWGTLYSGRSFPHHVVNGLWLVLSDALALGYPTLMCSAQCFMLHSDRAPFRKCLACAQDHAQTHKEKQFERVCVIWLYHQHCKNKNKNSQNNQDKLQCVTANMLQDSWMNHKGIWLLKLLPNKKKQRHHHVISVPDDI